MGEMKFIYSKDNEKIKASHQFSKKIPDVQ